MSRRRRTGRGWSDEDKIKYMRMMAIPLVVVVVLVIIILVMDKKPQETDATVSGTDNTVEIVVEQSGTTAEMSVEPDNSEYKTDFSDYELKKDEVPEVNQLISEYFQAKVDRDAQKLYSLFGKTDEDNLDQRQKQLDAEAAEIEDYQEITCYTKQGLTEDSYVVYVTYKIKFRRADSLAPGLLWCYVVKSEDGQYRIRENVVGEEADYVAKANQSEDVRLLASQINQGSAGIRRAAGRSLQEASEGRGGGLLPAGGDKGQQRVHYPGRAGDDRCGRDGDSRDDPGGSAPGRRRGAGTG